MIKFLLFEMIQAAAAKFGVKVSKLDKFAEANAYDHETFRMARPFTMTSRERLFELMNATRYVTRHGIPGAFVECGVWKGGSVLTILRTLAAERVTDRDVFLYDTFEGMTRPGEHDGAEELQIYEKTRTADGGADFCRSGTEEVRANIGKAGYPADRIRFVKGKVEDTIPGAMPERIALLRLDTDWYESTKHELVHMYPRLAPGGVLIIDDYGTWQGSRKATDEYFEGLKKPYYLHKIDEASRILIKG